MLDVPAVSNDNHLTMNNQVKKLLAALAFAACAFPSVAQTYTPSPENLAARKVFSDNRFGVFLHWGLYSMFAQGEWYMQNADIDNKEYAKAADAFYPHRFDARKWVKAIKDAGAKYICFTTRHHDGFSMWNTRQSAYNIMNTPFKRDVVRELSEACHEAGIGLHFYYSHIDWTRDDYPTGRSGLHTGKDPKKQNWKQYYSFMNRQLTELLTNYGRVDCIWFDGLWDHDQDTIPFDWQLAEQYKMIHRLQPACLIGNNHHLSPFEGEDIQIFERDVPGENKAGLSGQDVSRLPLETCQTMNGMWGYKIQDQHYKSPRELMRLLTRTAAKGANLLLNVGPQPNGELPAAALERLRKLGEWLNGSAGESIYATQAGSVASGDTIVSTVRTEKGELYLHFLTDSPMESFTFTYEGKPSRVTLLSDGRTVPFTRNKKEKKLTVLLKDLPKDDCFDTIIKIEK